MMNRNRPYNDLPLLPPKVELENSEILKAAIDANKALAELKGIVRTIFEKGLPGQSINTKVEIK